MHLVAFFEVQLKHVLLIGLKRSNFFLTYCIIILINNKPDLSSGTSQMK